jgi:large subunit ribosomal protein L18
MKKKLKKIYLQEKKRYLKKIVGTQEKPRLSVFKSHKHIYAQLIDDKQGHTIAFSSTLDKNIVTQLNSSSISSATQTAALWVGESLGQKAIQKQMNFVVFDRGNRPYHGRVKNIAEGVRKQGLIF